jgi:hypothetical protein
MIALAALLALVGASEVSAAPAPMPPAQTPAAPRRLTRIVVYDLVSEEIAPKQMALVTASLMAEIRKLKNVSVVGMEEVRAMLSAAEQQQAAHCMDDSCLVNIAGALGAQLVIAGSVGRVGESTVFTAKRINMSSASVDESVSRRMRGGSGEELLEALGPAVETLFPDFELRPGTVRGVPAEQVARFNPPPLAPWMTLSAAGTSVVLGLTAGTFYVRQKMAESDYRALMKKSTTEGVRALQLKPLEQKANSSHSSAVIFGSSAAVVLAASGLMYVYTDWHREPRTRVTPVVTPTLKGVSFATGF